MANSHDKAEKDNVSVFVDKGFLDTNVFSRASSNGTKMYANN